MGRDAWIRLASPHYKFHLTKHFALRMAERSLSLEHAKNVIHYPDAKRELRRGQHGVKFLSFAKLSMVKPLLLLQKF